MITTLARAQLQRIPLSPSTTGAPVLPESNKGKLDANMGLASGPRRSIHIRPRRFFSTFNPVVRVLPKHDDILATYAERWR
jgi:hypothetical protein